MDVGRVVLVSGANRGIGLAIAEHLSAKGWRVSAGVRDPSRADALKKRLDATRSLVVRYDATNPIDASAWVKATLDQFAEIDAVVINAGVFLSCGIEQGREADLDLMWEVNAKAPWRLVRAALAALKKSGAGRVVLVSSIAGKRVRTEDYTGYSMSKFALMALGQGLRLYGWEHGIRVSAVMPGIVATDMLGKDSTGRDAALAKQKTTPETIAKITSMVLELPNDTYIPEIGVANRLETGWA